MKTLVYGFELGIDERPVMVQHVFTCNLKTVQEEASELLVLVQVHVPLRRLPGEMSASCVSTLVFSQGLPRIDGFVSFQIRFSCTLSRMDRSWMTRTHLGSLRPSVYVKQES